jgi:hypothetical protein
MHCHPEQSTADSKACTELAEGNLHLLFVLFPKPIGRTSSRFRDLEILASSMPNIPQ